MHTTDFRPLYPLFALTCLLPAGCGDQTAGQSATCGNGHLEQTEACDDGNRLTESSCPGGASQCEVCNEDCTRTISITNCGNKTKDPGEECDSGPSGSSTCRPGCTKIECGDGILDTIADEVCDEGSDNSNTTLNACKEDCSGYVTSTGQCGNEEVEEPEQCDDGTNNSDTEQDACRSNCTKAHCGDGVVDTGEVCDQGADNNNEAPEACRPDCNDTVSPTCGDGNIDANNGETCDEGILNTNMYPDFCRRDCRTAHCGDGVLDTGEECDDGNNATETSCPEGALACTICDSMCKKRDIEKPIDSSLIQEAEAGTLTGFETLNNEDASEGKYIQVSSGDSLDSVGSKKAVYDFNLAESGAYRVIAWIRAPKGMADNDSLYLQVDGAPTGEKSIWDLATSEGFVFDFGRQRVGGAWRSLASWQLTAGKHTISIFNRRAGVGIDRIGLWPVPNEVKCGNGRVEGDEVCDDGNQVTERVCATDVASCIVCNATCTATTEISVFVDEVKEAEDGVRSGNFVIDDDASASGGSMAHVPSGDPLWTVSNHKMSYTFNITQGGTYRVVGWVKPSGVPYEDHDSFFVKVNGEPEGSEEHTWYIPWHKKYSATYATKRGPKLEKIPVDWLLSPGKVTIEIMQREAETRLDKIGLKFMYAGPPRGESEELVYVDANPQNTKVADPGLENNVFYFEGESTSDNRQWKYREGFGFDSIGNSPGGVYGIYEKDFEGQNDVGDGYVLKTTLDGLVPTLMYAAYVCYHDSNGEKWRIKAGLSQDTLVEFTDNEPVSRITNLGRSSPPKGNSDRDQLVGFIGNVAADDDGKIDVYIDDFSNPDDSTMRSWYEGVAYGPPIMFQE